MSYQKAARELNEYIEFFKSSLGTENVYLVSKEGEIVYSKYDESLLGVYLSEDSQDNALLCELYLKVTSTLEPQLSSFDIYKKTKKPAILIGAPIFKGGSYIGIIAFRISPQEIYRVFHDYSNLGNTGEVLIGKLSQGDVLFVNPIRHTPNSAFKLRVRLGEKAALPMQNAVQERAGSGFSVDYRKHDILAVWDYFPILKLGIVIKIDAIELEERILYIKYLLLIIIAVTIPILTLFVILVSKAICNPILKLKELVQNVGKGNLNVQMDIQAKDEVGTLALEFQKMLDRLKESTTSIEILNEQIEKNKKIVKEKQELISRISHELRTPIGPVISYIEYLKEKGVSNETDEQKQLLEIADRNIQRLNTLIDHILNYQQLSSKSEVYSFSLLDINDLIKKCVLEKKDEVERKGLYLHLNLDENLEKLEADEDKIYQALISILDNAIKFTDEGEIEIYTKKVDSFIQISFRDSGIGIQSKDIAKLFSTFRELEMKSSEKKQGFGLGLAIANQIIMDHGGKIWVQALENKGTVFHIEIPLKKEGIDE